MALDAAEVFVVPKWGQGCLHLRLLRDPKCGENGAVAIGVAHDHGGEHVLLGIAAFAHVLRVVPRQVNIVQVHDVYLPWDYPQDMCERGYSEQYVLAAMVMSNPDRYRPIFPAFWVAQQPEMKATLAPLWDNKNLHGVERHGGSFWFEIGPHVG